MDVIISRLLLIFPEIISEKFTSLVKLVIIILLPASIPLAFTKVRSNMLRFSATLGLFHSTLNKTRVINRSKFWT